MPFQLNGNGFFVFRHSEGGTTEESVTMKHPSCLKLSCDSFLNETGFGLIWGGKININLITRINTHLSFCNNISKVKNDRSF